MKPSQRLLKYVGFITCSDESSETTPSSENQFVLAKYLVEELKQLGVSDAYVDDTCYVYGHIAATPGYEDKTPIGFIAHMDTVSDFCDHEAAPIITENYDGGDVKLGDSGLVLSPSMFPELSELKGRTLITTDGTTVLGADDKAGVAEIMTMVEALSSGDIAHGPISIGFTPDEEIGRGAKCFDVARFGARYAYTVDGDTEGELNYETFNAAAVYLKFKGLNVHTGFAKDVMINAAGLAAEYDSLLPREERPEVTDGYEGFYHLENIKGNVGSAVSSYIIRDFDEEGFLRRQNTMIEAAKEMNKHYGKEVVSIEIKQQYKNMKAVIDKNPVVFDNAKAAYESVDVTPIVRPIRGGTDGSQLSYMGLPCPNLGTGGHAFHGPYEHITVEGMEKVVEILLAIVKKYAE